MPLRHRLLISALIGLAVFAISAYVGYQEYCGWSAVSFGPLSTLQAIAKQREQVEEFQLRNHALPRTLRDLPKGTGGSVRPMKDDVPLDFWWRPLHYSTDGTKYRISSDGRDSSPGGVGLDYDLSTDDLGPVGASAEVYRLPAKSKPPFTQFITDPGRDYNAGSGRMMFLTIILTGVVSSVLGFRATGGAVPAPGGTWSQARHLLAVAIATLLVAVVYLIPLHLPSGH